MARDIFTLAVHAGAEIDPRSGAIMVPIYQTSTYVQDSPGKHKGWDYSRSGNPTRDALEQALSELEGAQHGLAFSSGLAAEQSIVQLLGPGDEVLVCDDVYGGTGRLFRSFFEKFGLKFHFVDLTDLGQVKSYLNHKVKMIWVETPSNPLLKIIDIKKIAELAKGNGNPIVVVDNTFASPMFQRPLTLGADIVVHSTTKYLGGHSDMIGGAVMVSDQDLYQRLKFVQFAAGAVPGPFEAFLLHRSIKTLAVRMMQHEANAQKVAEFLQGHHCVSEVFYPGLPNHPGYEVARDQMTGFSGMMRFNLKGDYQDVERFLSKLRIFSLAESLGGVESLVNHPERMTHASVPPSLRKDLGIGPNLVRLSIGIESDLDLIKDLDEALTR